MWNRDDEREIKRQQKRKEITIEKIESTSREKRIKTGAQRIEFVGCCYYTITLYSVHTVQMWRYVKKTERQKAQTKEALLYCNPKKNGSIVEWKILR